MSPGVRSGGRQVGQGENQEEDKKRQDGQPEQHEDKFHLVLRPHTDQRAGQHQKGNCTHHADSQSAANVLMPEVGNVLR